MVVSEWQRSAISRLFILGFLSQFKTDEITMAPMRLTDGSRRQTDEEDEDADGLVHVATCSWQLAAVARSGADVN